MRSVTCSSLLLTLGCSSVLGFGDRPSYEEPEAGGAGAGGSAPVAGTSGLGGSPNIAGTGGSPGGSAGSQGGFAGVTSSLGGAGGTTGGAGGTTGGAGGTTGGAGGESGIGGAAGGVGATGGAGGAGGTVGRLLLDLDMEGASTFGSCDNEGAPLTFRAGTTSANCEYTNSPLAGNESLQIFYTESVACLDCWAPPVGELWAELLVSVESLHERDLIVLQPVSGGEPLLSATTGAALVWDRNGLLALRCPNNAANAVEASVSAGVAYAVTYRYSWLSSEAEVWLRTTDAGLPVGPRGTPTLSTSCPPSAEPTGWFAEGRSDTTIGGSGKLDNIRMATTLATLDGG